MDTFLRFDHWTLTKPEFSAAVFRFIVTFTWEKFCDIDIFLRFDTWTLTKPEFSGAVFTVIAPFTRNKFVILIFFEDLITEPWPNQSSLGQSLQASSLSPEKNVILICFWDLITEPWPNQSSLGQSLQSSSLSPDRILWYWYIFLRFDTWTLTKPEFSGAVFTVIVTFTRKNVIWIHFWDLITEPWPNQSSLGQSLESSSLSPEKIAILFFFEIYFLNPDQTRVLWGSLYSHRHFHQKTICDIDILRFDHWTLTKRSLGQSLQASSLSPDRILWYWYICEIW